MDVLPLNRYFYLIFFCSFEQVVFEGRRGISWAGDIALDDISLQDGQCPPQLQCSFEDPNLCGWNNVHGDNFDWTRANGYTASRGTGPSFDHTTGTNNGKLKTPGKGYYSFALCIPLV